MAAPALLVVVARSKTVRRVVLAAVMFIVVLLLAVLSPLLAVPSILGGTSAAGATGSGPTVVGQWGYPLAGDYTKSDGFGPRHVPNCALCSTFHEGYDMYQGCGATIYAAGPGTVIRAGAWGSYGNAVEIDHGGGIITIYGHMMWGSLMVTQGASVVAGTPIGLEGETGVATGCHLHFQVDVNGTPVDPAPFMAALGLPLK